MSKGWYGDTNIWGSFNEWFSRHLVDENQRVISDADIVSPADSTPQGIWEIDENSQIDMGVQLKSARFYSVEQIIGEDSVQVGAMVEKGDPMGYFLFGGSDIVMIFQDSVSLELASKEHVLMGEPYAEVTIE